MGIHKNLAFGDQFGQHNTVAATYCEVTKCLLLRGYIVKITFS